MGISIEKDRENRRSSMTNVLDAMTVRGHRFKEITIDQDVRKKYCFIADSKRQA